MFAGEAAMTELFRESETNASGVAATGVSAVGVLACVFCGGTPLGHLPLRSGQSLRMGQLLYTNRDREYVLLVGLDVAMLPAVGTLALSLARSLVSSRIAWISIANLFLE
jgi:hypothetical protein